MKLGKEWCNRASTRLSQMLGKTMRWKSLRMSIYSEIKERENA
jgi:hypothetical protein